VSRVPEDEFYRRQWQLICCISSNPRKLKHTVYTIGEHNGTAAAAFVSFCQMMVESRWLVHGEILLLNNAGVHTGREATDLEEYFWNAIIDGPPLNVLVVYLPTRSPELNPIELIFHIFSRPVQLYWMNHNAGPVNRAIIRYGTRVLDESSYETIL
jgi:transposase